MITIVAVAVLAATPIRLEEVREQSRRSTRALQAELDYQRNLQQVRIARSALFPQLSLGTTIGGAVAGPQRYYTALPTSEGTVVLQPVDVPSSGRYNFDFNVSLSQLLYDSARWAQLAQAGASADAAAGQAYEERATSELEGIRRFYTLFRAQRALEVLESRVRSSQVQLDRAGALFEAGKRRKEEVLSAAVNLGNDRIQAIQQRTQISGAQADLATWLARPGIEELEAADPGTLTEQIATPPAFEQAYQAARERRPLLKAFASQVRVAEEAVSAARAGYLPRVSASVTYFRQSPSVDPFFTDLGKQNAVAGGLNLNWDLFSGFGTNARVSEAEYARARAQLSLEQTDRELAGEVKKALAVLMVQMEVAEVSKANRKLAQDGLRLAEERFAAGAVTSLEIRDAQVKLTDAELSLLGSRIDVEIARAALERSMGALTPGVTQ